MNVLLAEDNPVNQEIALGLLETLDCEVTVVENGAEAVEAASGGRFDLVLMDCQMPVMDGFEAARAIRTASGDDRSLPIVALTANDFDDTRKDCLAAGMDDLVGKPFTRDQIAALLQRWRPAPASPEPATSAVAAEPAPPSSIEPKPIDALRSIDPDGERRLLERTITKFIDYSGELVARLATAVADGETGEVSRIAHSLKSSSANLGAAELSRRCADLEKLTAGGSLPDDIAQQLTDLQAAHAAATRDLKVLCRTS